MSADPNDLIAIHNLLNQYCHAVDRGSVDDIMAVFHSQAVLRPTYMGDEAHKGAEAVRAWYTRYDQTVRASVSRMRHKITSPYVEVRGDEATAVSYLDADFVPTKSDRMGLATGCYEDRLKKENGEWRIIERVIHVDGTQDLGQVGAFV